MCVCMQLTLEQHKVRDADLLSCAAENPRTAVSASKTKEFYKWLTQGQEAETVWMESGLKP